MNLMRVIIDAVLFCPHCGARHVDEARNGEKWHRRAHTTHRCQSCGRDWDVFVSGQAPDQPVVKVDEERRNPEVVKRGDPRIPPDWFVEQLHALQLAVFEHGIPDNLTIVCTAESGLRLGLPPGGKMDVAGPCGYVTVKCDGIPAMGRTKP